MQEIDINNLNGTTLNSPNIHNGVLNYPSLIGPVIRDSVMTGNTSLQDTITVEFNTTLVIDGERFTGQELRIMLSRLKGIVKDLFPEDLPEH